MTKNHCNTRRRDPKRKQHHLSSLILLLIPTLYLSTALTAQAQPGTPFNPNLMKYACGPANRMFATLSPASRFTDTTPGFDLIDSPTVEGKSCTSDKPFFFSVPIPEGNYRITVVLGGLSPAGGYDEAVYLQATAADSDGKSKGFGAASCRMTAYSCSRYASIVFDSSARSYSMTLWKASYSVFGFPKAPVIK